MPLWPRTVFPIQAKDETNTLQLVKIRVRQAEPPQTSVRKIGFNLLQLQSFFSSLSSGGGLRFLRMDSRRISMR
jgi:hypothetical protein